MVHYNWTIDQLKDRYSYLCRLYDDKDSIDDEDKRELLIKDLAHLKGLLDGKDFESKTESLFARYRGTSEQLEDTDFLWGDIQDFSICTKENFDTVPIKTCSLSRKDLLDLTHDFYKNCFNHFFFGNFMRNFYRRRDHVLFEPIDNDEYQGETININTTQEAFLRIKRFYTYDDLITTIHEYMHATSFLIKPEHLDYKKGIFSEVDAILVELIACDYFETVFKDHKMDALKVYLHNKFCKKAHNTSRLINLYEIESKNGSFQNNRELRRTAQKCGISDLDAALKGFSVVPTIDYMFAIEFYFLYKEDKEKALNLLKEFIMMEFSDDTKYYAELQKLGIYPNANSRELHKERVMLSRILKKRQ